MKACNFSNVIEMMKPLPTFKKRKHPSKGEEKKQEA